MKILDPERSFVTCVLTRKDCLKMEGNYIKDLSVIKNTSLRDILIVDNIENSFALQPENGILVSSFYGDKNDKELNKLIWFLIDLAKVEDVRDHTMKWALKTKSW